MERLVTKVSAARFPTLPTSLSAMRNCQAISLGAVGDSAK